VVFLASLAAYFYAPLEETVNRDTTTPFGRTMFVQAVAVSLQTLCFPLHLGKHTPASASACARAHASTRIPSAHPMACCTCACVRVRRPTAACCAWRPSWSRVRERVVAAPAGRSRGSTRTCLRGMARRGTWRTLRRPRAGRWRSTTGDWVVQVCSCWRQQEKVHCWQQPRRVPLVTGWCRFAAAGGSRKKRTAGSSQDMYLW